MKINDVKLGGNPIPYHIEQGFCVNDFKCYLPLDSNKMNEKKIKTLTPTDTAKIVVIKSFPKPNQIAIDTKKLIPVNIQKIVNNIILSNYE